jgi:hypothetical protein
MQYFIMLSVVLSSVITLSAVMQCQFAECRFAECHYADCRGGLSSSLPLSAAILLSHYLSLSLIDVAASSTKCNFPLEET